MRQAKLDASIVMVLVVVLVVVVVVVVVVGILWNWTDQLASEAAKQPHDRLTGE